MRIPLLLPGLLLLVGCPEPAPTDDDDDDDAADDDDDAADDDDVFDPGPEPTTPLVPVAGEVTIIQLELGPTGLGEAAIVVGPDGSLLLIDVGGSSHDDDVREAIEELNTLHLVPARGFPARDRLQVEWILLTHFHGDHVGGFEHLALDDDPVTIVDGVIHRGFVDVGPAANENDVEVLAEALEGSLSAVNRPLCVSGSCPGLWDGDLAVNDEAGPTHVDLGDARVDIVAANGHVSDGSGAAWTGGVAIGLDDGGMENARSLVGVLSHGALRYHFGGDLTGEGTTDEPDVESVVAEVARDAFYGPLGVDVAHAHHHARDSSSNAAIVDLLAPDDGRDRNVVAGVGELYAGSPDEDVVEAWTDGGRLGTGRFWSTRRAFGGADPDDYEALTIANGPVIVQTIDGGRGYRVQAAGDDLESAAWRSVR